MPTNTSSATRQDYVSNLVRTREYRLASEADFSDRVYAHFADNLELNESMFALYRPPHRLWNIRSRMAALMGDLRGKTVLDYGCGIGEESLYFALLGADVKSIDCSPVGIDVTCRRARRHRVHHYVDASVQDALAMDFDDETFDVVHGIGILHHLDLGHALQELARVMKPGAIGVFAEHIGNYDVIQHRLKPLVRWDHDSTEHELPLKTSQVRSAGARLFQDVDIKEYTFFGRLRRVFPQLGSQAVEKLDYYVMRTVPALRSFGSRAVIFIRKQS